MFNFLLVNMLHNEAFWGFFCNGNPDREAA